MCLLNTDSIPAYFIERIPMIEPYLTNDLITLMNESHVKNADTAGLEELDVQPDDIEKVFIIAVQCKLCIL